MARLTEYGLRRSVGVSGLFASAYGNVGSSIYYALGLVAAHALGLTPLVFLSSAYVPVKSMPAGVRQFSEIQPLTPMINAVRGLATGSRGQALLDHGTGYYVGLSLAWAAAIFVVFGILAVVRFARG